MPSPGSVVHHPRPTPNDHLSSGRMTSSIAIVNGFSDSNFGGAAITHAAIELCKGIDAGARVAIVAVDQRASFSVTAAANPEVEILDPPFTYSHPIGLLINLMWSLILLAFPRLPIVRVNPTVDYLRNANPVIAKGGYVFRQRKGFRDLIGGWFTTWPLHYARRCRATVILYSASIGPWRTATSRLLSQPHIAGADVVCPRDTASLARALQMTSADHVLPMPDCVFGLADDSTLFANPKESPMRDRLVFVPRKNGVDSSVWQWFVSAAVSLRDEFPQYQPMIVNQAVGDRAAVEELAHVLDVGADGVRLCDAPQDVVACYQRGVFAFSMRMHGAILAMMSECPSILVDVDPGKSIPVFATIGLHDVVIRPDGPEQIVERAYLIVSPQYRAEMNRCLARANSRVHEHRLAVARLARVGP